MTDLSCWFADVDREFEGASGEPGVEGYVLLAALTDLSDCSI